MTDDLTTQVRCFACGAEWTIPVVTTLSGDGKTATLSTILKQHDCPRGETGRVMTSNMKWDV